MRPILSAEEMAWVDRQTIRKRNSSAWELMQEVAVEMAERLSARATKSSRFLFLCGPGNNGGDAYSVAEILRKKFKVLVWPVLSPQSTDCKRAAKSCRAPRWKGGKLPEIIVDGIFGNSQNPGLEMRIQKIIKSTRSDFHVALDVPTAGFRADLSLMVGYPKQILLSEESAEPCGDIEFVGKAFVAPRFWNEEFLEDQDFKMPTEKRSAFKTGRVGVVAGSAETPGAAFLAAEAVARMKVGYVHLFYPPMKNFKLSLEGASFLYQFSDPSKKDLSTMDAWVLGPGGVRKKLLKKIASLKVPMVLDAAALEYENLFHNSPRIICTPHPGEAGRMLQVSTTEIQSDRLGALRALVKKTGKSVYLKGAPGIFLSPGEKVVLNYSLYPVLARAGSGDVFSGVLG